MVEIWTQSWFWPSVGVIVGLPIALLVLTEVYTGLVRRGSGAARIVRLVRNYVVPVTALFVLLTQTDDLNIDASWSKITATVLGFLVILVLINGINFAVFGKARVGSWRERLPSIFVDVLRFLVIVVSLAVLFNIVWGADTGGLFTALGIGSIVIGLALQNAVGSVLSGLLLLFEQPFKLGDWLDAAGVRGRVEEVNWRSVHIRTIKGIQVVPNSELAGASFTNLSRKLTPYNAWTEVRFTTDDPPQRVIGLLESVARDLPTLAPEGTPGAYALDKSKYEIDIPILSPGDEFDTLTEFRRRLWYAARRAKLRLDRQFFDDYDTADRRNAMLARFAATVGCGIEDVAGAVDRVAAWRYAAGEKLQHAGEVPDGILLIVSGAASMVVEGPGGERLPVSALDADDLIGLTSLTRQGINATVVAVTEVEALHIPVEVLDQLVDRRPALARDIGKEIDNRRLRVRAAFEAAGMPLPEGSRRIAY
ncbi:mechanosensitive ion channel family protein [Leifsonia sp. H3M29-4]|uniref:mechanosensitive ion channel family protein n=1 Tax=Salinibacterium metalliresistens TaxID=3031321 RepID=UPI0023DBCB83|nr:mechanosensitive ion channel family protein [Salinibacterium metalliresistens]MDF1478024.1 mechanosensitive ion channel family protein [Salinibacterium metalliresistens]